MGKTKSIKTLAGIGEEAVLRATGRTWPEWIAILDKAKAHKLPHPMIARFLHQKHHLSGWWAQMVTVGYEQAKGLRAPHEQTDGFTANASKTVNAPLSALYGFWADAKTRARWMGPGKIAVRKATKNRSMRIDWCDGRSRVEANFYAKGKTKSRVQVGHRKLAKASDVPKAKWYWGQALQSMQRKLEAPRPGSRRER